ncbi:MAG: ATP-binding protein [Burkholderiaceae bacterium]
MTGADDAALPAQTEVAPTDASGGPALLVESKELLVLAQQAGRFGIFEWQVADGAVQMSPHLLTLYGLARFDGRYDSWLRCIFREDRVRLTNLIEAALADRVREVEADFRITRGDDATLRWMEARYIVFYAGADRGPSRVVGINVDVTEQKRAGIQLRVFADSLEDRVRERTRELEEEFRARQKAEESLRQAQKMEAVGQLTGGIAHDFNNLLTVVLGGIEGIGRQISNLPESPATARIVRAKDMATNGARRAAALISRLMAFSRQQSLAPTPIDANKLVAGMCELLRRTLGESISVETVLTAGLWRSFADENQLESAILNLAVNARDAMPHGGKLTIETANCHLDDAYVDKFAEPVVAGQYVLIAVTDTGTGMSPSTIERAFEPFFTTKEVGKGTGLGLSQVYGFVRQSSGHVRIYSEIGEGTTLKIYLPRHRDAAAAGGSRAEPLPASVMHGDASQCVLVVEDDDALRAHATEMLRELGYRVLEAADGAAGLALLATDAGVDLLFTDVVMPGGMNGRQLADEAARRNPELRVLFTTGYTRNAIIHHGRLDAGTELLTKPYSFDELASKVRQLLDT